MLASLLACGAGFLLDWILGDPVWLYHPVRLIGAFISYGEKILRKVCAYEADKKNIQIAAGGLLWILLVLSDPGCQMSGAGERESIPEAEGK